MAGNGQRMRFLDTGARNRASTDRRNAPTGLILGGFLLLLLGGGPLIAQEAGSPEDRAEAALDACAKAAREGRQQAAREAADSAESLFRTLEEGGDPVTGMTGRARVLSQCRIPSANFMRQGALLEDSNELLEAALRIDPTAVVTRFTLGMNHYHSPGFLGRTDDAIRAFERLLADHGGRADMPIMNEAHLRLGELYLRAGQPEKTREVWSRGARTFPDSAKRYLERAREAGITLSVGSADPDGEGSVEPGDSTPTSGARDKPETNVRFEDRVFEIEPIVVEAGSYSMGDPRTATQLSKMDVYTMPGGTADVLQTFQAMPGVTRVTDGSDLYVRGGDPEESPVYLDGARLFYPGKFETLNGSIFGVLDPSVLRSAYFSAGGFSARYGNALSGVLDLETEGRPEERHWRAGLNLASLGGTIWQPLGAEAGVWGTAMATETSALLATHGRRDEYPQAPSATQGMAGLAFEPRESVRFRAMALVESDETTALVDANGYSGPFTSSGTTRLAALSTRLLGADGGAALRATLSTSYRSIGFVFGALDREREDRTFAARVDGDLMLGSGIQLRAGLEGVVFDYEARGHQPVGEDITPGAAVEVLQDAGEGTSHVGVYVESEARLTGAVALVAGVRVDQLPGWTGLTVDPRGALAYRYEDWTFRVGGGLYHQGPWRVRYDLPERGSPSGLPTEARHLAVGVQREGELGFRAEAYLKEYDDYVAHGEGTMAVAGLARGVDALLQWRGSGALEGWLSYSLLDSELRLGECLCVPSAVDVTHTLTAVGRLALGTAWELGVTGRCATGKPYTPVIGPAADGPGPEYGPVHGERLPDYVRLDARLTRLLPAGGGVIVLYLEALNLLDRPNVMAYTWDETYRNRRSVQSFFAERTLVLGAEAQF